MQGFRRTFSQMNSLSFLPFSDLHAFLNAITLSHSARRRHLSIALHYVVIMLQKLDNYALRALPADPIA